MMMPGMSPTSTSDRMWENYCGMRALRWFTHNGTTGKHQAGWSKRPSSKAAASEEARRTLRYVEPLSEARTKLADFFSILPTERETVYGA
jgi:hypothetical protein